MVPCSEIGDSNNNSNNDGYLERNNNSNNDGYLERNNNSNYDGYTERLTCTGTKRLHIL